jgi:uncharacterized SAM-binding protein YcdF (DUF218 family)
MFAFSKIIWWFVEPSNVFLVLLLVAIVLLWTPWRRWARRLLAFLVVVTVILAVFPIGTWMIVPLENRFPQIREIPPSVAGVITLGGAVSPYMTVVRDQTSLSGAVERLTEFIAIARRRPELRLVYTGGSGSLRHQDLKETVVARRLFTEIGFDPALVVYEDQSRNTHENAVMTHALIRPGPEDVWVLITSAMHMPRSVGVFRKAGWKVLPYPVDYKTDGTGEFRYFNGFPKGFGALGTAIKEWVGLLAYRMLGRTDSLFPAP